jgi:hypothetical protein
MLAASQMSHTAGIRILGAFSALLLLAFIALDYSPRGPPPGQVRAEDPVAYFGTAHSILFDQNFNLNNEYEHMPPDGRLWTVNQPSTGLPGSPWGLGYSLLEISLLAAGTAADTIAGNASDGYSHWGVFFYSIGNIAVTCLGLLRLYYWLESVAAYRAELPRVISRSGRSPPPPRFSSAPTPVTTRSRRCPTSRRSSSPHSFCSSGGACANPAARAIRCCSAWPEAFSPSAAGRIASISRAL